VSKSTYSKVKTSNCRPVELEIDTDLERLYVSTKEGMVLIFDVKNAAQNNAAQHTAAPIMIHTIRPLKLIKNGIPDYIKQMDLDRNRNMLICRSKSGIISCVQLINRGMVKSAVIEKISSYEGDKLDSLKQFKWLSRMSCYCEGTAKGYLKIRDIEKGGECILMLHTAFTDEVVMVHYNKEKNVLFAASKDGQFRVWKIPHEWRSKAIEERELNAEYERQRLERASVRNTNQ